MTRTLLLAVVVSVVASGCSHIASTRATFYRRAELPQQTAVESADTGTLVLQIGRHIDTIINGPDTEEDQLLVLELREFQLKRKLMIPSPGIKAQFTATRFGPTSYGKSFKGYVIVKSVSAEQVEAYLRLEVQSRTTEGTYSQKDTFKGDYIFFLKKPQDPGA